MFQSRLTCTNNFVFVCQPTYHAYNYPAVLFGGIIESSHCFYHVTVAIADIKGS